MFIPSPRRECREFFAYPSTTAYWAVLESAARSGVMSEEEERLYSRPDFFVNVYPETATAEDLDRCVKSQLLVVAWQNNEARSFAESVDSELLRLTRLLEIQRERRMRAGVSKLEDRPA